MSRPRAVTVPGAVRVTAERHAGVPRGRGVRRFWGVIPLLIAAGLIVVRGLLSVSPMERLAPVAGEPADPPGTVARAGAIAIERGGPVIVGFVASAPARLTVGGHEIRGAGPVTTQRILLPRGAAAIRIAAPAGARLVWSPVGRRGPPEYVPASSLSPEPPERAVFSSPGATPLDGFIGLGLLATLVGSLAVMARRRLAAVSRNQWLAMGAVLAVGMAVRLVGLGEAGQTWDEDTNWAAGRNYITSLLDLDFSQIAWSWNYEHPPVMKLLAGIGAQLADGFGPARVLSALWISLGCALLVPIGTRLYRFRVGVLAAMIAALLPPMIAHGQIVGHESPTVLWWSLAVLLALGVHDYLPTDERGMRMLRLRLAWVGAVVGVAVASRFVNGLLGPLCAVIVVLQAPQRWRKATLAWGAVLMPVAAVVAFYVLWPRLWTQPFAALGASLEKLDTLHGVEPFMGELTEQPGRYYFAVYLAATLPVGVAAGVVAWIVRAVRERGERSGERSGERGRATWIVLAWLIVPMAVALSPVRQDGVRYVMPCLAALAMMAAAGLDGVALVVDGLLGRIGGGRTGAAVGVAGVGTAGSGKGTGTAGVGTGTAGVGTGTAGVGTGTGGRPGTSPGAGGRPGTSPGAGGRPGTSPGAGASQSMRLARGKLPFLGLSVVVIGYLGWVGVRTAPYYLDYFGEHVGGAGTVAERRWFETAWWGEGLDRAIAYVNEHAAPGAKVHRECVAPSHLTWFREDLWAPMTRDVRAAEWIVVYAPATKSCPVPQGSVRAFEVVHDGAVLAIVYRRGG